MRAGFRVLGMAMVALLFAMGTGPTAVSAGVPKVVLGEDFGHEL